MHANEHSLWNEYRHLAVENDLPIRVFMAAFYANRDEKNFPKPNDSAGPMLSCDRVKIFADGGLGARTAAMSVPYKDGSGDGILNYPPVSN